MELDHEEEIDLVSSGDSAEECESGSSKQICPPTSRKFSVKQTATLNAFYKTGMKGEGKQYALFIEHAARESGLSPQQVKVSFSEPAFHCI